MFGLFVLFRTLESRGIAQYCNWIAFDSRSLVVIVEGAAGYVTPTVLWPRALEISGVGSEVFEWEVWPPRLSLASCSEVPGDNCVNLLAIDTRGIRVCRCRDCC